MPSPHPAAPRETQEPQRAAIPPERLRELTAAPLDEETAPGVLAAVLESLQLRYGALLRYDSDSQSLSLLAQEGLAPQAVDAIRLIRRGIGGVWDMPLHAVLQRRVYLIDKPRENPFVPQLVDGADQGLLTNVAVLPLFSVGSVTGALLLVGAGKRAIRESDILSLRDVAKALGAALRSSPKAAARAPHVLSQPLPASERDEAARDRATLTARISELESIVESLQRTAAGAPSAADSERRLGEIARERDRYKSEASLHEITLRNVRSEYELFRNQTTTEAERARKLALDWARAKEELAAALESRQRGTLEIDQAVRARAALEQRLTDLEQRLGEAASHAHAGQASRTELTSRLSIAEREVEELRASLRARDQQISELRGERERLTSSLQRASASYQTAEDSVAQMRESSEVTLTDLRTQIETLEAEVRNAERERDQLAAGLAGRAEIIREIERETEKSRNELAREVERRRVAEQTASSVIHDAAALRAEAERSQSELQSVRGEAARAQSEAQRLSGELEGLRRSSQADITRQLQKVLDLEDRAARAEAARQATAADLELSRADLEARRQAETALREQGTTREEAERKRATEVVELRQRIDAAAESSRALARERDALLARAATLQETTAKLLTDGQELRADREQTEQELANLRTTLAERNASAERLAGEVESLRAAAERKEQSLSAALSQRATGDETARSLEREVEKLRDDLERAQSHGSELTAGLARRAQAETDLRATAADTRRQLEETEKRRHDEAAGRQELEVQLREMETALQGASADLAEKTREIDFAAVLRATLAKSETARRSAEESVARLETVTEAERQTAARLRSDVESEREGAAEIARRLEEIERRLADSEEATAEANHRAALRGAEQAAAQETAQSLAAELGRRSAERNELAARFEALERGARDREAALQDSLRRSQSLEESARTAAQDFEKLKRQANATDDEKGRQIHELELRVAEMTTRGERTLVDWKEADEERERLRETLRNLESDRRHAGEEAREAAAKAAAVEAAVRGSQAENERQAADLDAFRQRAAGLEQDLRKLQGESERWRSLAEKLTGTLEERDREIQALRAPRPAVGEKPALAKTPKPTMPPQRPGTAMPRPPVAAVTTSRTVVVLDDPGPSLQLIAKACAAAGFASEALDNGASPAAAPALAAVNLLAVKGGGLEGLVRTRNDPTLAGSRLFLYAAKPGSGKGVAFANVECLIRPIEEKDFLGALALLLGHGKRITIIGEELDSVLKLNGWATSRGCSVSSAGDLKQGSEILDIVKPDLIVFDFSRLAAEGASLFVKARRSTRLEPLPLLVVLPAGAQSPSAGFFLKRLAALADETALDFAPLTRNLAPPS